MARDDLINDLLNLLPRERILTDPNELFVYESDGFTIAHARPAAVVFPISTAEVSQIVNVLVRHDAQIVPRGSGTGLAGGCVAYDMGVVVSTARMNRILKIDLENRVAHVEAGVRNTALSDAVAREGSAGEGSGFRVQGSVREGSGFRVQGSVREGSGFRVQGSVRDKDVSPSSSAAQRSRRRTSRRAR